MKPTISSWAGKLADTLGAEVSSRSLGLVRVVVGLLIWEQFTSPWVAHRMDDMLGTMVLAWIALVGVWFVIFGLWTRWAAPITALAFAGVHLYYGVHLGNPKLAAPVQEFQLLVLLALTPCGRSLSLDRALEVRRARKSGRAPKPERARWWHLELFVIQIASVFAWLGFVGTSDDWLNGEQLVRDVAYWYGGDMLVAHPSLPALCKGAAWLLTVSEFLVAALLVPRRLRPYGMGLGFVLLFIHMLLTASSFDAFYDHLVLMVPLLACLPPTWVDAMVSNQSPDAAPSWPEGEPERERSWARDLLLPAFALTAMVLCMNVPLHRGHVEKQARDLFTWTVSLRIPVRASICELRYRDLNRDGALIERWKVLGYERPGAVPDKLARITRKDLEADAVRVCKGMRKAGDDRPRVELEARCLSGEVWKPVKVGKGNLCWSGKTRR